ncbi:MULTISPECIES: alpha/beta hydrolase family protein [Aerosakkonema]|uniref:alpha/beta hydrolase family protein n=1 Tax=Aerosakkonema TaxID=1246629 RepID=UPI0035B85764
MTVRAFFRSVKVENTTAPHDTIFLKVLYPARIASENIQAYQGVIPADSAKAPFPVVIFFSGFNCEPALYQWLAVELVERGLVVVTFAWVAEYLPGIVGITPGVNIAMSAPDTYGTGATALALPAILAELDRLQMQGILAGMLDLQKIVLGGHSGGGRLALENADPRFYPQVAAAFSYGAHSAAATMLGFAPGTFLPLPSELPMLLIGGTRDGVIAASRGMYGLSKADPGKSIEETFDKAIVGGREDCYLVLLEGANHFSITYPPDATTGSSLFDLPATQPEERIRSLLSEIVGLFIEAHIRHKPEALQALKNMLINTNALIAYCQQK